LRDDARYERDQANRKPFRDFSIGALGGMSRPIYAPGTKPQYGTLGGLIKK